MKQGWEIKKLGEVCERHRSIKWRETTASFYYIDLSSVDREKHLITANQIINASNAPSRAQRIVNANDVIIGTTRPTLRRVAVIPKNLDKQICSSGFCVLSPKTDFTKAKWLYYLLLFDDFYKYIEPLQTGASYPAVTDTDVLNYPIPVPSLLEQGRIVGVLDAAFAKIDALKENAQKNLENAKALFQQVLKQELTPKPNWQTKKLGEIALKKLSYGASVPSRNFDGEYRYIRITDIDEDGKLLNDLVSPAVCEEKHILHSGDLLLARTGGTIGKSYLYSPEDGKCIYAGYLIRVIVNQDIVLPEFVFFNTKTDRYWNFIKKSQKTAAQPNINAQQYSSFDIPYPSKDEQEGIVRKIKSIFTKQKQLEKCCQKTIAECDAFKQAVLRRAFNGEL